MVLLLVSLAATVVWGLLLLGGGTLVTVGLRCGGWLETASLRLAVGLAVLPAVPILLYELVGLPVRPLTAVAVGGVGLALAALELRRRPHVKESNRLSEPAAARTLLLLLLGVGVLFACLRGALLHPGFEGRDPWGHAQGIAYVADTGSLRQPFPDRPLLDYVDAYPPLYDVLMALPCGWSGSIQVGLKAANALVVALANLVFFLLARELLRDDTRAMVATVVYAVMPGNLTRHPWGHSVAIVLLLAGLVCALEARRGSRWVVPCGCCFGGALLAAPSQGLTAGVVLALTTALALAGETRWAARLVGAGGLALLVGAVWLVPAALRYGASPGELMRAMQPAAVRRMDRERLAAELRERGIAEELPAPYDDIARVRYNLDDLLFFRPFRAVLALTGGKKLEHVVPTGLGVPVVVLAALFVAAAVARLRLRRFMADWRTLLLAWLGFALLGTFGGSLGVPFFAWRFWLMLTPFAALAAADGLVWVVEACRGSAAARGVAGAAATLCAGALLLALWSDLTRSRLLRYWPLNPALLLVAGASLLWASKELRSGEGAAAGWSGRQKALAGFLLAALVGVAAPIRAKALTEYVAPKGFFDPLEQDGYLRVWRDTERGASVFPLSGEGRDRFLIGLDHPCRLWRDDELAFSRSLVAPTPPGGVQLVSWLEAHGYRYLVADPSFAEQLAKTPGGAGFAERVAELERQPGMEKVFELADPASGSRFVLLRLPAEGHLGPRASRARWGGPWPTVRCYGDCGRSLIWAR